MTRENRSAVRRQLRFPATVTLKNQTGLEAQTMELSLGGLSFLLREQIRPGQYCAVVVEASCNNSLRKIMAVGQIIYSIGPIDGGYMTGLQFLDIDADSSAAIKELLAVRQH